MKPSVHSCSYLHRGGLMPLLGSTLDAHLRETSQLHAEREAVVSLHQSKRLRYAELDEEVERLARGMVALGIGRGTRVGVWSTNNLEWVLLQLATGRVGAILVTLNPAHRTLELRHALRLARVETLFLIPQFRSSNYVQMLLSLAPDADRQLPDMFHAEELPDLASVVLWDPERPMETERPARGFFTWQEVLRLGESVAAEDLEAIGRTLDPDDPINIQFTSGTTGAPKATVLTHHNLLNNAWFGAEILRLTEKDRLCVPVPFYHCFGMVLASLACFTHGACLVIPAPHFDAEATLAAIARERCTVVHGVPTMFIAMLEQSELADLDLDSLRTGIMAGAPCPPELVRRVMEELGCRDILIGYGQTETSPLSHITRPEDTPDRRVGTVGTLAPHQEVKIVDPATGAIVPRGTPGEVCLRGYHVMRGYFDQPQATREVIDEAGWLHSGDVGVMDGLGYLSITGRIKEMIIRGGENLFPAEIEALFYEHPAVEKIAVFGVSDERLGEEVGAWVQLREGEAVAAEELAEWAKGRIAHFKIPRHWRIVDGFPMTVTGKIQRFRIRELMEEELRREGAVRPPSPRSSEPSRLATT